MSQRGRANESITYCTLCRRINRTQTQVGSQDLPNHLGLEPHVRFRTAPFDVRTTLAQFEGLKRLEVRFENFFREPCAQFTHGLKFLGVGIVASEKEGSVHGRSFAFAIVPAHNDEIERISNAFEVILLQLDGIQFDGTTGQ